MTGQKIIVTFGSITVVVLALVFWVHVRSSSNPADISGGDVMRRNVDGPRGGVGFRAQDGHSRAPAAGLPGSEGSAPRRSARVGVAANGGGARALAGSAAAEGHDSEPAEVQGHGSSGAGQGTGEPSVANLPKPAIAPRLGARPNQGYGEAAPLDTAAQPPEAAAQEGLLFSVPFGQGGVNPTVGGAATQADGLVPKENGVEFNEKSHLSYPAEGHVQSEAGTISFDVTANWGGGNSSNQALVTIGTADQDALQLVKNATELWVMAHDWTGTQQRVRFPLDEWSADEPHKVAVTWDAQTQRFALMIDGDFIGSAPYGGFNVNDKTDLRIGSDRVGGFPSMHGTVGSFQISNKASIPDEAAGQQ